MSIRKATLNDVTRIREIAELTWPNTYSNIISPEQITYMLNWMYSSESITKAIEDPKQDFFVWENNGKVLGFAGIEHHYQEKAITRLHKLYVLPETQGTGAGKQLLETVKDEGRKNGSEIVHLNVNKANPAVSFYNHCGFMISEEEVLDIGNGFVMDDYIMTLNL